MKKIIFVLPFCLLFAYCSHKTVSQTPTGISNVSIGEGDAKKEAIQSPAASDKDWPYKTFNDTVLNGSWTLEGMLQANGTWSTTEKAPENTASTTIPISGTDTAMTVSPTPTTEKGTGKNSASKRITKRDNALYEGAKSRLKMDYKGKSAIDTAAPEPYKYWTKTPVITFHKNTFYGNTGCNSMSGSVNYSANTFQFGRNIATSKMACMEYDEANFLTMMKKADTYSIINGKTLEIRQGTTVLMTFKRS